MTKPEKAKPPAFERFEELAKRLVRVPKKDVDEKERERPKRERRKPDSA